MKYTIRKNTFETNSSSTHSLVIVTGDEYQKLKSEELFMNDCGVLQTKEFRDEAIRKFLQNNPDVTIDDIDNWDLYEYEENDIPFSLNKYFDDSEMESFKYTEEIPLFESPSGTIKKQIVAFGKFGYNG